MLTTVRARILAFALLSVAAVAGLTFIAWMIIAKAEHTSQALVGESLEQSWMLVDLEQDHRLLQDLAYKIKAQLLAALYCEWHHNTLPHIADFGNMTTLRHILVVHNCSEERAVIHCRWL